MESIIKLITKPEFYFYLRLSKDANVILPKFPNSCVMCHINDTVTYHVNLQKRLKFINRNGVKYTANNLCYECASPKMILFVIYNHNDLDVFNKSLTDCRPKNLNSYMIDLYLKQYKYLKQCKYPHIEKFISGDISKVNYLISNSSPMAYNWEIGWEDYSDLLLKYGNEINTSNCLYTFVTAHHLDYNESIRSEIKKIIKFKTSNMFDRIMDLDYLGNQSKIMAILFISKFIKIEVDEKSNLGKLVKMLQL